jgi:hypothetical protein
VSDQRRRTGEVSDAIPTGILYMLASIMTFVLDELMLTAGGHTVGLLTKFERFADATVNFLKHGLDPIKLGEDIALNDEKR